MTIFSTLATAIVRRVFGAVLLMAAIALGEELRAADDPPRPNILFLLADDVGYGDLACYGSQKALTPHLDRLAEEGTRFMQFYVSHAVCSPPRASAITGQFPARQRIYGHLAQLSANARRGMPNYLAVDAPSMPRALQRAGYRTAMIGKWHLGGGSGREFRGQPINDVNAPQVARYGFDRVRVTFGNGPTWRNAKPVDEPHDIYPYFDEGWQRYSSRAVVDETLEFIEDHVENHKDAPFYANVWFKDAHTPYNPTEEMLEPFAHLEQPAQSHYAMIHYMDAQIGRLLARLDALGLREDTLVLFATDNGHIPAQGGSGGPLRGGKFWLYEAGIRVPLIVRWPDATPAGKVDTESVLNIVDFTPTFCRLAGAQMPEGYQPDGEDITPALRGNGFRRSKPQYWHHVVERFAPQLAIREGAWKLLMQPDGSGVELYQLEQDVGEKNNVARQHPEVVERLKPMLARWYREIKPQTRQPD